MNYDFLIIGGGASAFAAAIRANELNAKTAMINWGLPLGGTCVNVGCVPSKTLLHAAETLHHTKNHGIPGLEFDVKNVDFAAIVADELALIEKMRTEKYQQVLEHLEHVTFFDGKAAFSSPHQVTINQGEHTLTADKILIATGSRTFVSPVPGLSEVGYLTNIEALKLQHVPQRLTILGGGAVALEFAQLFSRFGSQVTILQRSQRIYSAGEPTLTEQLANILTQEGITIRINTTLSHVSQNGNLKTVHYQTNGQDQIVEADEILLAMGKTPNTDALDLSTVGVQTTDRQAIQVNQHLQTNVDYIYAAGDVTNLPLRLETTAGHEGTVVADNALQNSSRTLDYDTVPYAIFTDPQLAGIGYTEARQMAEFNACSCRTVPFTKVPKAIITRRTEGMIQLVIHPQEEYIMGMHILAPQAGDLIAQAIPLIKNKVTVDELISYVPMFPTMSEAIKIAAISFRKDISKLSCCV